MVIQLRERVTVRLRDRLWDRIRVTPSTLVIARISRLPLLAFGFCVGSTGERGRSADLFPIWCSVVTLGDA